LKRPPAEAQTNVVPLINQPLTPPDATPGGKSFIMVVNGTGFVSGATVNWNGNALATSYVSAARLKAQVPAADIASAGSATITVTQPGTGGSTSLPAYFEIGDPTGSLSLTRTDYPSGTNSHSLVAADFDGDGVLDLAVVNTDTSNFTVLTGNGDGTFQLKKLYKTPAAMGYLVAGDFNGDGTVDLAGSAAGYVYVFAGHGDGTFAGAAQYAADAAGGPIATADFNRDGKLDFATTNAALDTVAVVINGVGMDYPTGASPAGIVVGDFNRDGKLDLAVANYQTNTISILLGNGDGTFRTGTDAITTEGPIAVAAADLNGDGKLDLIVATPGYTQTENDVTVLIGNGDGTFQAAQDYPVSGAPAAVTLGDFNNDGKADLAVANRGSDALTILLGNGDGTFRPATDQSAAGALDAVAIGDFNRDGYLDVGGSYAGGSSASAFISQNSGQPTAVLSPASVTFPLTIVGRSSAPLPVTLSNTGTGTLNISSISTATQFSSTNNCGSSLKAGGSCTINVVFTPEHQGLQTGTLSVTDNATGSPQTASLSGQATFFIVSPLSLDFGNVQVGATSPAQNISIYGEDSTPEKVSFNITPTGDTSLFPYKDTCNGIVPSHAYCHVYINFAPTATGPVSATFNIKGGGGNTKVSMTGTGTSP
jgi:FG-GAP-like repeat/Abnormal spindle-like microcephaly-assoc'd, ASPM-SPD-2-Hydin